MPSVSLTKSCLIVVTRALRGSGGAGGGPAGAGRRSRFACRGGVRRAGGRRCTRGGGCAGWQRRRRRRAGAQPPRLRPRRPEARHRPGAPLLPAERFGRVHPRSHPGAAARAAGSWIRPSPLNPVEVGPLSCAGISSRLTYRSGSSQAISNSIGNRLFPRTCRVRPLAVNVLTAASLCSPPSASRAAAKDGRRVSAGGLRLGEDAGGHAQDDGNRHDDAHAQPLSEARAECSAWTVGTGAVDAASVGADVTNLRVSCLDAR